MIRERFSRQGWEANWASPCANVLALVPVLKCTFNNRGALKEEIRVMSPLKSNAMRFAAEISIFFVEQ